MDRSEAAKLPANGGSPWCSQLNRQDEARQALDQSGRARPVSEALARIGI